MMKLKTEKLNLYYDNFHALKNISCSISENSITSIIGPSGCGKSTFIRIFNRMNDVIPNCRITGKVFLGDEDIYSDETNIVHLRRRVGMVFQRPNVFPLTVFENIAYGPRIHHMVAGTQFSKLKDIVENCLHMVGLSSNKANESALDLPPADKQLICIARVLAVEPEVILLDEPCSTLDPIATAKIETLLQNLSKKYTIVIVTHNMQQAARISDWTGFMLLGELIEFNKTSEIFTNPSDERTKNYISGKYG